MKIILCGYHWAGCKALELLLKGGHQVFVFTHKMEKSVPDLEGLCVKRGVSYSLNKIDIESMPFIPDVICSVYYRYIIGKDVIDKVKGKIFNLHPSLLPKYRGCSSVTWAMINGENECGFTFHYIDANCDTGNIILQKTIPIESFDTQLTLYYKVMFYSMEYFDKVLDLVINGFIGEEQMGTPSYNKRGCPMDGLLTDDMSDEEAERFIRAMINPPYPLARYKGKAIDNYLEYLRIKDNETIE